MKKIEREQLTYIAALANLELTEAELEKMERDLGAVLEYVDQLNQIETAGVEPMAHVLGGRMVEEVSAATLRPDRTKPWFGTEQALANAPASGAGMFVVPKIIERA